MSMSRMQRTMFVLLWKRTRNSNTTAVVAVCKDCRLIITLLCTYNSNNSVSYFRTSCSYKSYNISGNHTQGCSYEFVIGTAIGEGSGGLPRPPAGPGQRPGGGPGGEASAF